jgi:hypothetical protein
MRCKTLLLVSVLAISGCVAYKIPERPQGYEIESSPVPIVLQSGNATEYEQRSFAGALEEAHGVRLVDPANAPQHGHMAATLMPEYDGRCFAEPMFTVLTFGVLPSVGCAPHGFRFELSGGPLAESTLVDARGDVPMVWGWAALFMLLSDNWVGERGLSEYEASRLGEAIDRAANTAPNE